MASINIVLQRFYRNYVDCKKDACKDPRNYFVIQCGNNRLNVSPKYCNFETINNFVQRCEEQNETAFTYSTNSGDLFFGEK